MKIRFICVCFLLSLIALLASCIKSEQEDDIRIISACKGDICSFELGKVTLLKTTNILNKTTEKVIKKQPLTASNDNLTWDISGGQYATAQQLDNADLPACEGGGDCTINSNPTGYVFATSGVKSVSVSGTITMPDGSVRQVEKAENIDVRSDIRTQYTIRLANSVGFSSEGNDSVTGISWVLDTNELTFTCPSGYGIPGNAPQVDSVGDEETMENSSETGTGLFLSLVANGDNTSNANYTPGMWKAKNTSLIQNTGLVGIVCVPVDGVNDYSLS